MKKILGILVLFFAFTINASAQQKAFKQIDANVEAKNNVVALSEVVKLEGAMSDDLNRLFIHKFKQLNQDLPESKKAELATIIEMKLRATLTSSQMDAVEKKAGLLKLLTN